jgi:hypothetical protein
VFQIVFFAANETAWREGFAEQSTSMDVTSLEDQFEEAR